LPSRCFRSSDAVPRRDALGRRHRARRSRRGIHHELRPPLGAGTRGGRPVFRRLRRRARAVLRRARDRGRRVAAALGAPLEAARVDQLVPLGAPVRGAEADARGHRAPPDPSLASEVRREPADALPGAARPAAVGSSAAALRDGHLRLFLSGRPPERGAARGTRAECERGRVRAPSRRHRQVPCRGRRRRTRGEPPSPRGGRRGRREHPGCLGNGRRPRRRPGHARREPRWDKPSFQLGDFAQLAALLRELAGAAP
jgi:hypothetical protein